MARWGVLCGKEEYTEGVGGAQNEKESHIDAEERRKVLRSAHTSGGALNGGVG